MNPLVHNVFVTGECNLACPFCFSARIREGVPDDAELVAKAVKRVNASVIRLCGGEPFATPVKLHEICQIAPAKSTIIINTNGLLLTESLVEWVNDHGFIVQLSVDGYDQGYRPLTALDLGILKAIDRLWVNQILFHPEDADPIQAALEPEQHEVGLLFNQRELPPAELASVLQAATGRFLSRIDSGNYNEMTTHHNGRSYYSDLNKATDYCVRTRRLLGELTWQTLRHRPSL